MTLPTDPLDAPADPVADEAVQIEAAESELRRLGLEEIRVRHHGDLARLEAPHGDLASMTSEPLRGEVLRAVRSAGFRSVAVDLEAVTDPLDG
jgi:PP-loop superfamily ATP-utilizing enzyme